MTFKSYALASTYYAVSSLGITAEGNPLDRSLYLQYGCTPVLAAITMGIMGLSCGIFLLLRTKFENYPFWLWDALVIGSASNLLLAFLDAATWFWPSFAWPFPYW